MDDYFPVIDERIHSLNSNCKSNGGCHYTDLVQVVRCKNCLNGMFTLDKEYIMCGGKLRSLEDYCSDGIRRGE